MIWNPRIKCLHNGWMNTLEIKLGLSAENHNASYSSQFWSAHFEDCVLYLTAVSLYSKIPGASSLIYCLRQKNASYSIVITVSTRSEIQANSSEINTQSSNGCSLSSVSCACVHQLIGQSHVWYQLLGSLFTVPKHRIESEQLILSNTNWAFSIG